MAVPGGDKTACCRYMSLLVASSALLTDLLFCRKCKERKGCAFFVVDYTSDTCYLKSTAHKGAKTKATLVAGTML